MGASWYCVPSRSRNTVWAVFLYFGSQEGQLTGPSDHDELPSASLNCLVFLDLSQDPLASQEGLLLVVG
jgi:hypothetical protein